MKINVTKVLKREAREKARVKPLPKVRVGKAVGKKVPVEKVADQRGNEKQRLLQELETDMHQLRKQRQVLSSQNHKIVAQEIKVVEAESPALLEQFLRGNVARPTLAAHYASIQSITDRMMKVWDDMEFVKQHGKLPAPAQVQLNLASDSAEIRVMHDELHRLKDLICKTKRKLTNGTAKQHKIAEWNVKVALAEARREDLRLTIKRLQNESREQRAGSE